MSGGKVPDSDAKTPVTHKSPPLPAVTFKRFVSPGTKSVLTPDALERLVGRFMTVSMPTVAFNPLVVCAHAVGGPASAAAYTLIVANAVIHNLIAASPFVAANRLRVRIAEPGWVQVEQQGWDLAG
jgi:hypothetical protein